MKKGVEPLSRVLVVHRPCLQGCAASTLDNSRVGIMRETSMMDQLLSTHLVVAYIGIGLQYGVGVRSGQTAISGTHHPYMDKLEPLVSEFQIGLGQRVWRSQR
jgi:hypothetical protein